ncbi:DUF943 family protein [Serratia sp. UGAL515B_01]|uniref:DUF943 family protein n=1 Tax=Serratia sp. UGAL515B_01 TaxID=2986763 RepID=UPI002953E074|nr:DUF943 family protein [Serratia sp. UGAL515B_01]WON77164.1 DUF943 family protein [Serratia sp. UGAL515B_01]
MIDKNKIYVGIIIIAIIALGFFLWLSNRPVEIVAVHQDGNFSSVLVRTFPLTDKGKINWWLENRDMLKAKYNIPQPASYGLFTVNFWDFGDGYKEEGKYDRRCFNDMKTNKNCIEKNIIFTVSNDKRNRVDFTIYDGDDYRMNENGDIIKIKSD